MCVQKVAGASPDRWRQRVKEDPPGRWDSVSFFVSPSYHKTSRLWTLAQDIFELLNGDVAALGLGRCTWAHCGFASVVFYGAARHTSALFISGFLFDSHEAITTLSPGGLFGGEWPLPPEDTALGTAAPRSSTPSTTRQAAGRRRSVAIIAAGLGVKTCSEDTW